MEQIKTEPTKSVKPWQGLMAMALGMPTLAPLYALYATWVGHLITGAPWNIHRWAEHNLYSLVTCGLIAGLAAGVVALFMPRISWAGRWTRRQWAWMAVALVLIPVAGPLLLR